MNRSLLARLRFAGLAGLLLFAPDDGTGTGGTGTGDAGGKDSTGAGGASPGQGDGTTPPASTDNGVEPPLTAEQQARVDAEVQRQFTAVAAKKVNTAREQWESDLKALADAENQTAEEQANARAEAAEQAAAERVAASNARLIAADAKVAALDAGGNPARVDALLKLADLGDVTVDDGGNVDTEAVRAAVDKTLADYPEFKAAPGTPVPAGPSGSDPGHQAPSKKPGNLADAVAAHYAV